MTTRALLRSTLFVIFIPLITTTQLSAVVIDVSGQIVVTADFGTEFKAGDTFNYSFSFDDTASDTNAETYSANFNGAVSAFTLVRNSANEGSWNPASGTFDVAPIRNFSIGANGENITLQFGGSGFESVDEQPFFDVTLSYSWSGTGRDFVDTGLGQTFSAMVGGSGLDFATAGAFYAEIRNDSYDSVPLSHTVTAVPEPSSFGMIAGLAGMAWAARRRVRR